MNHPIAVRFPWQRPELGTGGKLHDAILSAVRLFSKVPDTGRKRAVLLISDDRERGSRSTMTEAVAALRTAGPALFLLVEAHPMPQRRWEVRPPPHLPGRSYPQTYSVRPIVEQSGGSVETSARATF
jgi:hypothetical protein